MTSIGRVLVAGALLAFGALPTGCRITRAEEWQRRDNCAERLPVLRAEPTQPYRVIKVVEGEGETDLAWQACAEGAQALISLGAVTTTSTHHAGTATVLPNGQVVYGGRDRVSEDTRMRGYAIRYIEAPDRPRE